MLYVDLLEYKLLGFHLGARFSWGSPIDDGQDAVTSYSNSFRSYEMINLKVKNYFKADYAFLPFHLHADNREKD